jgi:hypothetical protein
MLFLVEKRSRILICDGNIKKTPITFHLVKSCGMYSELKLIDKVGKIGKVPVLN